MKFQDLKYLLSFSIPLSCWFAIQWEGLWSWATLIFAFVIIPTFELILEQNIKNDHISDESEARENSVFFDILLYLNLPIVLVLLYFGFDKIFAGNLTNADITGKILSLGVLLGACGINVAHELGHKQNAISQITSKLLLTPCLYNHFTLQHNRGHHLNVGTDLDPASSRKNEILYSFWWRSTKDSYMQAWELELSRMKKMNISFFSLKNEMLVNSILLISYLALVGFLFNITIMLLAVLVAIVSFLLLETINYIEHYGLTRKLLPSGKYERVEVFHSWNSDHQLGRIVLYELTRHADHHYKANKKYQILLHYDESPQLPFGYPASLLLSLVPPLWFKVMNPLVERIESKEAVIS